MSIKKYGFDLLADQAIDYFRGEIDWMKDDAIGDSEIEKLFFLTLWIRTRFATSEHTNLRIVTDANRSCVAGAEDGDYCALFIEPQAQIGNYRVDFLILAIDWRLYPKPQVWRKLVVECDGHDFHERTKEQAAKDRSRDRDLILKGFDVFRFTGSELWRDPWKAAQQVFDWAIAGWP